MKKRTVIIILLLSLLLDVQRVGAATTPKFKTVNGIITSVNDGIVYWSDGDNIYYFYSTNVYKIGDTITNVMDINGKHVFIGVNKNA